MPQRELMIDGATGSPRLRRSLAGGISYGVGPLALSALGLPVMAWIIRQLGPQAYGEWMIATSLVGGVTILANLGLRGAFVRAVARDPRSAAEATARQLGLRLALCVPAMLAALLACMLLGYSSVVLQCTAISAAGLLLVTAATTLSDVLAALHRLHVVAAVSFVSGVVLTAVSAAVIWCGGGPVALAAAYLAGPLVSLAATALIISRRHFALRVQLNLSAAGDLLGSSRHFTAQQIVGAISAHSTMLLLPALVGPVQFGFFAAGALLATRLAAIPNGLAAAFYPLVADRHARAPRESGRQIMWLMLLTTGLCAAMAAAVALLSGPIAHWLFPSEAELCRQVMRITIWSLPLLAIGGLMGYGLNAAGEDAAHARLSFVVASINLLLTVGLVWQWGLMGASWALLARYVVLISLFAPRFLMTFFAASLHEGDARGTAVGLGT